MLARQKNQKETLPMPMTPGEKKKTIQDNAGRREGARRMTGGQKIKNQKQRRKRKGKKCRGGKA